MRENSILRVAGSLWFAAVLLVLLMVAMGSATVYETTHGTEQALATFYHTGWFRMLLGLVAVNALAALALRWPFHRRQIGFLMTHGGLLLILAGSLLTRYLSVSGQVAIAEGQTVASFTVPEPGLTVVDRAAHRRVSLDLDPAVFAGVAAAEKPRTAAVDLEGGDRVEVLRYLPDTTWEEKVLNDAAAPRHAVEVSLAGGAEGGVWIFDGQRGRVGSRTASFRWLADPPALARLVAGPREDATRDLGTVRIEGAGVPAEIPLAQCLEKTVPVAGTPFKIRVLRYLPHAVVDGRNQIRNASNQPVNPAIEVELTGPDGPLKRVAFARFPDFGAGHASGGADGVKIIFRSTAAAPPAAPIEIVGGAGGTFHARFSGADGPTPWRPLEVRAPLATPWGTEKLTLIRHFDRARRASFGRRREPVRETREPAVLVRLTAGAEAREAWVPLEGAAAMTVGGRTYEVRFGRQEVALGFRIKLNRFRIGRYPGGRRPRSFESHVTITDPTTGGSSDRIISMNHPATHRGLTFYQSSYRGGPRHRVSVLSVSSDPDQPVVFAGYVVTILGMLWVMVTRAREQRRQPQLQPGRAGGGAK